MTSSPFEAVDAAPGPDPTAPGPGPTGTAVLVLGPEGAGLAAVAGLLGLLGCDLPRDLTAAGPHEGRGAWESAAVAGLPWPDPAEARAALDAAFGPAPLPLLKGAALARALPAWLAALESTGRGAVAVLVVGPPPESDVEEARDAWARDALRAERASRGLRRAVCDRDRLLADWREEVGRLAAGLGLAWPARAAGDASAAAFVAGAGAALGIEPPGLATPSSAAATAHPAGALAELLARWGRAGEDPADRPGLDRLARELGLEDGSRPEATPRAGVPRDDDPALADLRAALARAETARAEAEARLAEAATLLARSERMRLDEVAAAETRTRQAEASAQSASSEADPDDRLAALEADLAAARHERDQMASALRQRSHEADEQALARAAAEAALLRAQADKDADLQRMERLRRDVAVLKRDALGELGARLARLPATTLGTARDGQHPDVAGVLASRDGVAGSGELLGLARPLAEAAEAEALAARLKDAERRAEKRAGEAEALAARLKDAERRAEKRAGEAEALAARVKAAERGADKQRAEADGLAARLRDAERRASEAQRLAEAARAEVETLRRSTSWRLTGTLRSALRALRGG